MPRPPAQQKLDFERIKKEHIDEWITAEITEVAYDPEHQFRGKHAKTGPAVRFKFNLDGYEYPHYSRWMTFIYSEKSNLFLKYGVPLVEGAIVNMDMPTEAYHGMRIKIMFGEKPPLKPGDSPFQSVEKVKPLESKIPWQKDWEPKPPDVADITEEEAPADQGTEEEAPF